MNDTNFISVLSVFQYQALDNDAIRLLTVIRNHADEALELEISSYQLAKAPPFCALSYTWGSGQITDPCICRSGPHVGYLGLTQNLASILKNIRSEYYPMRLPIWADQICINQRDNQERSKQVQMMGEIYMAAENTLIVLGEAVTEDLLVFEVIGILAEFYKNEDMESKSGWHGSPQLRSMIQELLPLSVNQYTWTTLRELIHKPWFDRTWVIQELILSRNPYVACGKSCIGWDEFYQGCSVAHEYLTKLGAPDDEAFHEVQFKDEFMTLYQLYFNRPLPNRNVFENEKTSLSGCLASFGHRRLADPHDKIYAFLGVAQSVETLEQVVNYDEPYYITFARAIKLIIQQDTASSFGQQDLGILEAINPDAVQHRNIAPSWVPDFQFESANPSAPQLSLKYPEWDHDLERLEVKGVRLGRLTTKVTRELEESDYRQQERRIPLTARLTQTFGVNNGLEVNVHHSCQPGDYWYVLQGLDVPCILRQIEGEGIYRFCSFSQGYPFEAGACLQEVLPDYKYPSMSSTDWYNNFYYPWMKQEGKEYPFKTEDIILV